MIFGTRSNGHSMAESPNQRSEFFFMFRLDNQVSLTGAQT